MLQVYLSGLYDNTLGTVSSIIINFSSYSYTIVIPNTNIMVNSSEAYSGISTDWNLINIQQTIIIKNTVLPSGTYIPTITIIGRNFDGFNPISGCCLDIKITTLP